VTFLAIGYETRNIAAVHLRRRYGGGNPPPMAAPRSGAARKISCLY